MGEPASGQSVTGAGKQEEPESVRAMKLAFRAHLLAILEKPFNQRMLFELESAARIARDLIMTTKDPRARRARSGGIIYPGGYSSYLGEADDDDAGIGYDAAGGQMSAQLVQMPGAPLRAETFGATLVRELVASMQDWRTPKPTVSELVSAIASAKAQKLDEEIVASLEAELKALVRGATLQRDAAIVSPTPKHEHEQGEAI